VLATHPAAPAGDVVRLRARSGALVRA
jgi:hypothetical protein